MSEGGGLHPARPTAGGGSDASQSSTELLRLEEDKDSKRYLGWAAELRCWAGLMGYGQVSPSSLIFSSSVPFLFVLFPGFNSSI
jgi:hypothetical protein